MLYFPPERRNEGIKLFLRKSSGLQLVNDLCLDLHARGQSERQKVVAIGVLSLAICVAGAAILVALQDQRASSISGAMKQILRTSPEDMNWTVPSNIYAQRLSQPS
jgi:hypothetical protein